MKKLQGKLTYANVVSTLCLFLLLGGASAFAATQLGKNSVGPKQIKKNAVTTAKIKNGAVTSTKLSSSAKTELKGATGPQGAPGATGAVSSPTSLFRRETFAFKTITASDTTIATLAFTPTVSGNALVDARGWCNIEPDPLGESEINLKIGKTIGEAGGSPGTTRDWGVLRLTKQADNGPQVYGFAAEHVISVTAGQPEEVFLFGIGPSGAGEKDCSGSITIQAIF